MTLGKFREAHEDFDSALQLKPTEAKYYHAKGLTYQSEAEQFAKTAEDRDITIEDNYVECAIEKYRQSLVYDENFLSSMFHLGLMFRKTHKFSEAIKMFSDVETKLPNDKTVYIQRGLVFQDMKNHQAAIKDFQKAIELDATNTIAQFYLAVSKLKSN